jgi:drug/metabolite transporter (DMT)-like permease
MAMKDKKFLLFILLLISFVLIYAVLKEYTNNNPYITLIFYSVFGFFAAIYGSKKLTKERTVKNKIGGFIMIMLSIIGIYFILFSDINNNLIYGVICVVLIIPFFFIFKGKNN